jgi:hypothetical protein
MDPVCARNMSRYFVPGKGAFLRMDPSSTFPLRMIVANSTQNEACFRSGKTESLGRDEQLTSPATHSSQDAYGRGERIRTSDPLVPNQVLYQAEPLPELAVGTTFTGRKVPG